MENNEQNAGQDEQQQPRQTNDQPRSYGDAREPDKSLVLTALLVKARAQKVLTLQMRVLRTAKKMQE